MLELGSVVLALVQGSASALASRLMAPKNESSKEPIDIRVIVDHVAKELRAKDAALEVSISEMANALKSLRAILERVPEFEVKKDYEVAYRPRKDSDLGDVLYRLDEEIASLRKSATSAEESSDSRPGQLKQTSPMSVPSILEGLDEEIASLRSESASTRAEDQTPR